MQYDCNYAASIKQDMLVAPLVQGLDGMSTAGLAPIYHTGKITGMGNEIDECTQQVEGVCISVLNEGLRIKTS